MHAQQHLVVFDDGQVDVAGEASTFASRRGAAWRVPAVRTPSPLPAEVAGLLVGDGEQVERMGQDIVTSRLTTA